MIVLICRGPLGTGMEEIYQITAALRHLPFGKHVAVLTDARFSGVSTGACIGHVGPEALAGGPIGKVRDGDIITISVANRSIDVNVAAEDLARRNGPGYLTPASGYLANFRETARGLETGGVLLPEKR